MVNTMKSLLTHGFYDKNMVNMVNHPSGIQSQFVHWTSDDHPREGAKPWWPTAMEAMGPSVRCFFTMIYPLVN